ncbi:hypothetical protein [Vagococcus sp. WN89Y]|uniref:hypothetical protein n=1 Tax=Vagococcus sp. WN89Y TaxID=3457258 RepID=UPI003FCCC9AC
MATNKNIADKCCLNRPVIQNVQRRHWFLPFRPAFPEPDPIAGSHGGIFCVLWLPIHHFGFVAIAD